VPPGSDKRPGGVGNWRRISGAEQAAAARESAGYRVLQHEVEHCELLSVNGCTEHRDEHDAKHGVRSGRRAAAGEE